MTKSDWIGIELSAGKLHIARLNGPDEQVIYRPAVAYVDDAGKIITGAMAEPYRQSDPKRFCSEFIFDVADPAPLFQGLETTAADLVKQIFCDIQSETGTTSVVIAVPAGFTPQAPQRNALLNAASKAGFKRVEFIYTPVAVVRCASHISGEEIDGLTLVYDLDGDAFSSSLVEKGDLLPNGFLEKRFLGEIEQEQLAQTLSQCSELLQASGREWSNLTRVCLAGGGCRNPLVRDKITAYLKTAGADAVNVMQFDFEGVAAKGAVVSKQTGVGFMDAVKYEQKRNELIRLLDEVLGIDELREETRTEIEAVQKKSLENNFEIVLVGEFQGGKSTTFNAICDGREISPRGAMIKTSACKISACNLADPKEEEYCEVFWKTDRDLLLSMIKVIASYLQKAAPDRFGRATREQMIRRIDVSELLTEPGRELASSEEVEPLDFRNPDDLKLIRDALKEEWAAYNKQRDSYGQENLDVLYISTLAAHFVTDPEIAELRKTNQLSVEQMGTLVTFPSDWTTRWQAGSAGAFQPKEIAFAFIASVCCHIHSPNLARLGCVVTDCPGLFTSPWDTEVAQQAMLSADAILYLFGGEKTLTQGDIRALNQIRLVKMEHKLVYAINVKGKLRNIRDNILPENVAKLRAQGFDVAETDIQLYHALLGLCSKNGPPILSKTLDSSSVERFIKVAQSIDPDYGDSPDKIWVELADEMVGNIVRKATVENLSEESIEQVSEHSGLNDLFEGIEQAVIAKKAHAILVSQGAERASKALAVLEGDLHSREEAAKATEAEFKMAVVKSREELEVFQKEAKICLQRLDDDILKIPLAEHFEREVVEGNIDCISDAICDGLAEQVATISNILKFKSKERIETEIAGIIRESINEVIDPAVAGWLANVERRNVSVYNAGIYKEVVALANELHERWGKEVNQQLLDGLKLQVDSEVNLLTHQLSVSDVDYGGLHGAVTKGTLGGVGGRMAGALTAAIVSIVVCMFIPLAVTSLPGLIITLAAGGLVGGVAGTSVIVKAKTIIRKNLKAKVVMEMESAFGKAMCRDNLRKASLKLVGSIVKAHAGAFSQALVSQRRLFEERVDKAKVDFEKSEAARRALAAELNLLRTTKISPVKGKVDDFLEDVLRSLKTTSEAC